MNSYSDANVESNLTSGGLVGFLNESTISNSYSTGHLIGGLMGGLTGTSNEGIINNSYSTATFYGPYGDISAGLIGMAENGITVSNCAWLTSSADYVIWGYDNPIELLEPNGWGTDEDTLSNFYSRDHNVYVGWGSMWKWRTNNYPILSWQ